MQHQEIRETVDRLVAEIGLRKGSFFFAEFSIKDILDRLEQKNNQQNQNFVTYVIRRWYPGVKISPGQSDNGGFVKLAIRSI